MRYRRILATRHSRLNAETKPRAAPKDWTHILAELPEKDNIQEGMKNSGALILDREEKAALREAIKTRIKNGDVTVSQGCLGVVLAT